ncbi:Crp/Fnr family transcriptional regulator [Tropicimonas sp. IMCC6043]|uniref:Crp/Fnr family transcriptional regulator n=1 Tax=Tropicimonas sp. IMCC6043 TaxID=2510645 RepID=UPI00101D8670|nr:cyclic nucleotide-binding domain-containing protein [Tropicimonas sp. IMCC6043]RYH09102.1 cyclic nucleotide-binding domain-containing protein [Tropicimonas sp. IMCC6043]
MELTIDSAFSTGGLVGHFSYLLLVVSMLMRKMIYLRLLVIASSLVAIAYVLIWLKDPVGIFWESLLVTVNIGQLAVIWYHSVVGQFTEEERLLTEVQLGIAEPALRRRLLSCGVWCDEPVGTELTREGTTPSHLVYLAAGQAQIFRDGHSVAKCGAGNFVGEMSLFQRDHQANASAVVSAPARCWKISHERIRHLRDTHPELARAIDVGLARDMRRKIETGNASRVTETAGG